MKRDQPSHRLRERTPETLDQHTAAMQQSPPKKRPRRTMPKSTEREHQQYVNGPAGPSVTVAAQRQINVIAEPVRKRNVPASPKFTQAGRRVGPIKISHQRNPEQSGRSAGNVTVP